MPAFRFASIRARLTLWYSAVLGALVVSFAVGSFVVIREVLARRADRFLRDAVDTFSAEVAKESDAGTPIRSVVRDELIDYRFREIDFFVFDQSRLLGRSEPRTDASRTDGDVDAPLSVTSLSQQLRTLHAPDNFTLDDHEGGYRVASARVELFTDTLTIAAVQSWHGYAETLELIALGYWVMVPLLLLLSTLGGYWLAARGLAPVAAMSRKAASIGGGNLRERLVAPNAHDEIGELAAVFNGMLARLDEAFAQQVRFMQDASHELRSPIAAVRMEAEVTLQSDHRAEADYRDALATIRQSTIRLSKIVDDLFLLARHDAEHDRSDADLLDLGETVQVAVRRLRPVASARGIRLELDDSPESPVRGRAAELERMVLNLVDNALKYAPMGSLVRVVVAAERQNSFSVRVSDEGPGIGEHAQTRIFDRFYRAAPDGEPRTEGAGLGLPIARALAESHGGRLELESTSPSGTTFVLFVPRALSIT